MLELDLLCKLEKHYNSLDRYSIELKELLQKISINETGDIILKKEKQIELLANGIEDAKGELRKLEQELKGYSYEIEEIDTKLYSGQTKDINQLEKWSIEKESIDKILNDAETKALELMEKIENTRVDLDVLKKYLREIKTEYNIQLTEYQEIESDLNKNIETENKNIDKLEKKIDSKLLKSYKRIRNNKKTAVAQVENNICSGCNITISTYVLEIMKKDEEIVYCELCGRILCKEFKRKSL